MKGFITAWLGRVIATGVAVAAGWVLNKTGIAIDAETQTKAVEVVVGVMLAVYAVAHKLVDAKLNPTDAAAPDVVTHDKVEVHQKRMSGQMRRPPGF